jgi:hypothetical protein
MRNYTRYSEIMERVPIDLQVAEDEDKQQDSSSGVLDTLEQELVAVS